MEIPKRINATLAAHFCYSYQSQIKQDFPSRWRLSLKQTHNAMAQAQEDPKLTEIRRWNICNVAAISCNNTLSETRHTTVLSRVNLPVRGGIFVAPKSWRML